MLSMKNYIVVRDPRIEDSAILADHPEELDEQAFRFDRGNSLKNWVPIGANYPMSPQWPDRRVLYEFQSNTLSLLIVSGRCKTVLEAGAHANLEFLPISIINHRGKLASGDYFIVNILGGVDCMDRERSVFKPSHLKPSIIASCSRLVLKNDKIPEDVELFRLSNAPTTYIIKQSLKDRLEAQGVKGAAFIAEHDYNSALY